MKELEEKIISEGKLLGNDILKVGSFLNQQVDTLFLIKMAKEVKRLFGLVGITKILTIEASGIPFACAIAIEYGIPFVFAKKGKTINLSGDLVSASVYSFTHKMEYQIFIPSDYISSTDKVLIVDDFLANGQALNGLISIVNKCHATIVGCAVQIEKKYQDGGDSLRKKGYRIEALASIVKMTEDVIEFN